MMNGGWATEGCWCACDIRGEWLATVSEDLALFQVFDSIDVDGDGSLDRDEMKLVRLR